MTAPLYRAPWFLALGRLSRGAGWALHSAALSLLGEQGGEVLSEDLLQLALAGLPTTARRAAVAALLALGLWVRTPGGYRLLQEPSGEVRHEPPPPSPEAIRKRRQRDRRRDTRGVTEAVTPGVTPPVTGSVTASVTGRDAPRDSGVFPEESPTSPGVTPPVTAPPSREPAPACAGENSPLLSSPDLKKEEGEGEENSPSPPPSGTVTPGVTPPGTAALAGLVTAALAGLPSSPSERDGEEAVSRVVALWSELLDRPAASLAPRDLDAIRVRLQERAPLGDFRAAFAWAASEPWYREGDRCHPRLICGSRWDECRRKGRALRRHEPPPSAPTPEPSPTPPPPSAPRPAPDTLPYASDPYRHPTRVKSAFGTTYQPVPEEGLYLRTDLFLARRQGRAAE